MELHEPQNAFQKVSSYEAKVGEVKRAVLLYSGGLDTSVMLKWLQDEYNVEVIALTIDLGQMTDDLEAIKQKAIDLGAVEAIVIDAKEEFASEYIVPAIKANASYQGEYYMSTCIGRPLLSKLAVKIAKEYGADCIAHGCTGKGNDQVRIEAGVLTLDPDMKIIAPIREWSMGRDEEIEYALKNNIPISHSHEKPYSYDENMWGSSAEGGEIENPALEPEMKNILAVCSTVEEAPNESEKIKVSYVDGIPTKFNGKEMSVSEIVEALNTVGAKHGVGVTIHIEDRMLGLKIRDIYEAPAAHILIQGHKTLEKIVSTREENMLKHYMDERWAYLCYSAKWFDPSMKHIAAFMDSMNKNVTGELTFKLYKGQATIVSIDSPYSLFRENLATFMKSSGFNQNASPGFVEIYSLESKIAAQVNKEQQ